MTDRWPFVAEKIATRLALIAPLVARRRQPLAPFRLLPLPGATPDAPIDADSSDWEEVPHQSYWGRADLDFVLSANFTVPAGWNAERLVLHLPLGALGDIFNHPEALVRVDGAMLGSADRYHHTLRLDPSLADGTAHRLVLHGWTGLASWPPDTSSKARLYMGVPALVERDPDLLAFHRLASSALDTVSVLAPDAPEHAALLAALDRAFLALDTRDPLGDAFYASAPEALAVLRAGLAEAGAPLDVTVHAIGHAHMDIAYLWPISQIRLKNARTYSNVLRLMDEDPDYRFSHSQPALYAMTAEDYPDLFQRIRARVAEGRWEVMGGAWVEPDMNLPGAEALVRQLVLGRTWFEDAFGPVETPILWLPDTFGFPGQTPQLMRLAGLKWFATNKLNWNQRNPVPSSTHIWEGLDGTRVLAHVLTTPRDVQYLPFPTNYKSDLSAREVLGTWTRSTAPDAVRDLPVCFGYGDGGGGPTEDLLAKARAFAAMPGMPRVRFSTVRETFERLEAHTDALPVWSGEHYLEGHRGVYTSQGWIKRANRKAEWALHEAEALSAMAGLTPDLTDSWRRLCLNQFHDIVTGSSIGAVFADARRDFDAIRAAAEAAAHEAASRLALDTLSVANTSPVGGPRLAMIEGPETVEGGQAIAGGTLVCLAKCPAYAVSPVRPRAVDHPATAAIGADGAVLENAFLRVNVASNGQLAAILDKETGRDVLPEDETGNRLQAFEDRPITWDAWDIDPFFEDRRETIEDPGTIDVVETGPVRAAVRVRLRYRASTIEQTIRLTAHSRRIDFVTQVDWHETHILLKAAFPTRVVAPMARFDVQWGSVERPTGRATPFDAARFEVPAHKWALLEDADGAVALLNDGKYGHDVTGGTLRLTLIKSSTSPDPQADQGRHAFTYALLPMAPGERDRLDREAYDLNAPLRVLPARDIAPVRRPPWLTCEPSGVLVETLKPAETGDGAILRLFESRGVAATARLRFASPPARVERTDIFEREATPVALAGSEASCPVGPYEIVTLRVVR